MGDGGDAEAVVAHQESAHDGAVFEVACQCLNIRAIVHRLDSSGDDAGGEGIVEVELDEQANRDGGAVRFVSPSVQFLVCQSALCSVSCCFPSHILALLSRKNVHQERYHQDQAAEIRAKRERAAAAIKKSKRTLHCHVYAVSTARAFCCHIQQTAIRARLH